MIGSMMSGSSNLSGLFQNSTSQASGQSHSRKGGSLFEALQQSGLSSSEIQNLFQTNESASDSNSSTASNAASSAKDSHDKLKQTLQSLLESLKSDGQWANPRRPDIQSSEFKSQFSDQFGADALASISDSQGNIDPKSLHEFMEQQQGGTSGGYGHQKPAFDGIAQGGSSGATLSQDNLAMLLMMLNTNNLFGNNQTTDSSSLDDSTSSAAAILG